MDVPNVKRTEYQLVNIEDVSTAQDQMKTLLYADMSGFPQLDGR